MTNDYFDYSKFIDVLSLVLSIGYHFKFSTKSIEKKIIESKYFKDFLDEEQSSILYKTDLEIAKEIYPEINEENIQPISYKEIEWTAMMYGHILKKTKLNFETVFIYISIQKAYETFTIYHEMSFSQSLDYFLNLRKESVISRRAKILKITTKELAESCGVSMSTINFLRTRKSDISKLNVGSAYKISKVLNISLETLLSN